MITSGQAVWRKDRAFEKLSLSDDVILDADDDRFQPVNTGEIPVSSP